jgi:5,10-methenyltetrahydromethanopterin hydrogenase
LRPDPHEYAPAAKLTKLGIIAPDDPEMRMLGSQTVTREVAARSALQRLSKLLAEAAVIDDLDDFDPGHLSDAADAVVACETSRTGPRRPRHLPFPLGSR